MTIKIRVFILLISFLLVKGADAQNIYKLNGYDLSFSTTETLNSVTSNPGYCVYRGLSIEVSISLIRVYGNSGIENELVNNFSDGDYTQIERGKIVETSNQKGMFILATRTGSNAQFAKGIILLGGKAFLIEITYNPEKIGQVKEIINSFYVDKVEQPQASISTPVNEQEKSKQFKHPVVNHPNLIKLTSAQKQEFLDAHNKWRTEVGVPPLVWSDDLENYAAEWAIINGEKDCNMEHRTAHLYGENLYWSSGMAFSPKDVVDTWGSEIKDYQGEVVGQSNGTVGHYTQVVWRTTTEVGCAAFQCGGALLVVCNYSPPGNWVGQHPYKK